MPSASSKPANQTASMEAQDTAKMLIGMVEKKVRNLEKRKAKLENYRQMVTDGKTLNKDQESAVSHFDEVLGMLDFARDLQKTFITVVSESSKQHKKQAKKEESMKQEAETKKIRDVLLLQNVLYHLGNENVRGDFQTGANGAVQVSEDQLNLFDEFYKLINPAREGEGEEEEKDPDGEEAPEKSFEQKLDDASEHLTSYVKAEDKEACGGTSYKEFKNLVDQIHDCGYLDNIPEFPEAEEVPAVTVAPAEEQTSTGEDAFVQEEEEIEEPAPIAPKPTVDITASSTNYGMFSAEEVADPSDASEEASLPVVAASEPPQPQMEEPHGGYASEHIVPEPIEMPPPKGQALDVSEVLASVQGSFNFVQDSMVQDAMVDYESPHMDPAVLAVSQAFIPTQSYTSTPPSLATGVSSQATLQLGQTTGIDHSIPEPISTSQVTLNTQANLTTVGSLSDQTYSSTDMSYGSSQSAYDRPPQGLQSSLGVQQTLSSQQTLSTQQTLNSQQVLSSQSTLGGSSQSGLGQGSLGVSAQAQGLGDLSDYSSSQIETQMKSEDPISLVSGTSSLHNPMMGSQQPQQSSLSHSSNPSTSTAQLNPAGSLQQQNLQQPQDSSSTYSQSLGSNQMSSDSLSTQMTGISEPPGMSLPREMRSTHGSVTPPVQTQTSSNITAPKSTMNASAPPFQMTGSQRSSPQMQSMQSSQINQSQQQQQQQQQPQDMSSYQAMDSQQQGDMDHSQSHMSAEDTRDTPPGLSNVDSNDYKGNRSSYTTYNSNYQPPPNTYRNGNRNRGGSGGSGGRGGMNSPTTYRNNRSGMPFVRATGPRYGNNQQSPRSGPNNYNSGYIPRDNYNQGRPDMGGYNNNPNFGSFSGRPQQQEFYRRGGPPRGPTPRGGRGGMGGAPRGQYSNRGGGPRGGFGKPSNQQSQVTA
ncbi:uncharacterized protein [Amphiura filiformis]|uniref:uncharacterized protein isoform X2 n=1 Tax=Amphiura filiformis TaxID=82378 RepID=UPI003B20EF29